ncbi:hypothetical protein GCM10020367_56210 [Streptomyces sannanensis]|uniref:Tetratricopeptide repeat protein n=1 Tax=Streptomyces sannanensis TaxID=285536 RepID=A0ABP6SJF5_9ACTN
MAGAGESADTAVQDAEPHTGWCAPYALVTQARVRIRTGDEGAAELLERARNAAVAQGDRQAQRTVRSAQAELSVRDGRPKEALELLAAQVEPGTAYLAARARLGCGRPDEAAEPVCVERAGEGPAETEALTVHAVALAALGRERDAREGFDRAAALADALPYPAGARQAVRARDRALSPPQDSLTAVK